VSAGRKGYQCGRGWRARRKQMEQGATEACLRMETRRCALQGSASTHPRAQHVASTIYQVSNALGQRWKAPQASVTVDKMLSTLPATSSIHHFS
jgi:hypothetical protein